MERSKGGQNGNSGVSLYQDVGAQGGEECAECGTQETGPGPAGFPGGPVASAGA